MKKILLIIISSQLIACDLYAEASGCPEQISVKSSFGNEIVVDDRRVLRELYPEFFSFNLEWIQFQSGFVNRATGKVNSDIIQWLTPFSGAIYRYPGGTSSNHFDWTDAVGPMASRPSKKNASWAPPFQVAFGLDEYLDFVKSVNGKAWYVANLYGDINSELAPQVMAKKNADLAAYLNKKNQEGAPLIYRWELGNELDRDVYKWPAEKLVANSSLVADSIHKIIPQAKFVALLEDYPAQKNITEAEYNRKVISGLAPQINEYAKHMYYDGEPSGPPVPHRLRSICNSIADGKKLNPNKPLTIWMTEHARVPPNAFVDPNWKRYWKQTADLEAAIGVADILIASAQIPELRGAFIHSLHGAEGPWPLFHKERNDLIQPSAVYWAMRIFRDSMLDQVLPTATKSVNYSAYKGGYDLRSVVMASPDRTQYALWAINRSDKQIKIQLSIPALSQIKLSGKHVWLSDKSMMANNYSITNTIQPNQKMIEILFNQGGATEIVLPPQSVSSLSFKKN